MLNVADRFVKDLFPVHRFGVREHMNAEKQSERNDSGQLVQFSQEKIIAEFHFYILANW